MGAKKQLLRPIDDVNPDPELAAFEARLVEQCNKLGVGPMGFGVKIRCLPPKLACCTDILPVLRFIDLHVLGQQAGEIDCGRW